MQRLRLPSSKPPRIHSLGNQPGRLNAGRFSPNCFIWMNRLRTINLSGKLKHAR
jgi:hypothetical protein